MLCGLQGSGKTTTCGKLGRLIRQRGRKPMLVAADLQRPAAIQQLQVLGQQLDLAGLRRPQRQGSRGAVPCRRKASEGVGRRRSDPRYGGAVSTSMPN